MDGLGHDLDHDIYLYHLYQQLLPNQTQEGAAAFFQPPPPPPPQPSMLDQWEVDPAGYLVAEAYSALPQPLQGGGIWEGNDDGGDWARSGELAQGQAWVAAAAENSMMLGSDVFPGNDQFVHGEDFPTLEDLAMRGVDLSKFDDAAVDPLWLSDFMNYAPPMVPAAEPNQPASDSSGPSNQESPGLASQMPVYPPVDYPQPHPHPPASSLTATPSWWPNAHQSSATIYAPPPMVPAAGLNQPASDSYGPCTQFGGTDSPELTSQMPAYYPPVMDYQQPPPASVDAPQAMPDDETAEVAQMVGVAVRCDDKVSTDWSEEENQVLREGLSRFAGEDNVTKCFNIASGLANKTVTDVAYRIRWLSDLEQKKKAAKQAQLEQEKSAKAKVTKGKGTKGPTRKNNKHPLSKDVLNSKSAKDLIRDSDRLMDKIEEILRTGQVKNSADDYYYVKMNMDALQNKVTDMSSVMEGLSVHDEEWKDVLKDCHSLAGKDTSTPP